ncbi:MAG: hypothetical protein KC731_21565, partial [Myxococcales bacterium]|nr:hypothetical protein [Myxococcales bacterium]
DYERTLREIFRIHDQSRLAKVYATWEAGKKALEAEKWEEAAEAFDQVLARAPLFEHRAAMAPAYLKRGERLIEEEKWEDAAIALRKAERLRPEGEADKAIDSRLLTLEARSLMEAGTPDRSLLERAVELDPENAQAKALLASFEQDAEERRTTQKSYGAVIGTGAAAVLLLLGVWLPGRRKKAPTKATPPTTGDPSKIASAPPSEEAPPTGKEAPEPEAVAEPPEPPAQGA